MNDCVVVRLCTTSRPAGRVKAANQAGKDANSIQKTQSRKDASSSKSPLFIENWAKRTMGGLKMNCLVATIVFQPFQSPFVGDFPSVRVHSFSKDP